MVDTAASISVVNKKDSNTLTHKYKLNKPEEIKSATGSTVVTEAGEMTVGSLTIPKVIMLPDSPSSVVAMADINRQ